MSLDTVTSCVCYSSFLSHLQFAILFSYKKLSKILLKNQAIVLLCSSVFYGITFEPQPIINDNTSKKFERKSLLTSHI